MTLDVSAAWGPVDVGKLAAEIAADVDEQGRAGSRAEAALKEVDSASSFTPSGRRAFEALLAQVGVATCGPIGIPTDDTPYWLREGHPLAGYRSAKTLPAEVDVVVIGAGLTGASTAYHLADAVRRGDLTALVLDQSDPASEASGRNAGHFETIPENSVGLYEGLATERFRFLRRCHPGHAQVVLRAEAERQASAVLRLALHNRDRLRHIISVDEIDCDFAPRGWLYLASTEAEEQGICDEVVLAAQHGERIELWSRAKIHDQFGFDVEHLGRFVPGDGSYHPFKYACGLLQCALDAGVQLFARVGVNAIEDRSGRIDVRTAEGVVRAGRVIIATNAFTSGLLPELAALAPRQSQVMLTEHVLDRTRGRIVTSEQGPTYFNQPRSGRRGDRAPLLMGGGDDRPMTNPLSRRRSAKVHAQLLTIRDTFYPELAGQPPSGEWIGPMGFTPDQLPAIGEIRPGVIVAAGFNGYGGSYTTAAGEAVARLALTGSMPEWLPEDVFSPQRLVSGMPMFLQEHDSLWRIAASLCQQLRRVNAALADAIADDPVGGLAKAVTSKPGTSVRRRGQTSPAEVTTAAVGTLAVFAGAGVHELEEILSYTRGLRAPAGTTLFRQGEPGGSCLLLLEGYVEVALQVSGRPQRVARLGPGAVLGQISLVEGTARSATCTTTSDVLFLDLDRAACATLLASRTPAALRVLGAINDGLIAALRSADRRLVRLRRGVPITSPATLG